MPPATNSARAAEQWRLTRRLYPIYAALALQFDLGQPPYGEDLRGVETKSEPEVLESVERWLAQMDERIQAHQFRHVLQGSDVAKTEQKLHALVERYHSKRNKGEADRDKLDFLLAHYFSACAPPSLHEREVRLEDVADVLEPVLGECSSVLPGWLAPLEQLVELLRSATSLADLNERKIIPRGRQLKAACQQMYFGSSALVAFTRFNYIVSRTLFRLMNSDIAASERAITQLRSWNVLAVDCTGAQLDPDQSLASVAEILTNYKTRRAGEYGIDDSLRRVIQLRAALETAVARHGPSPVTGGEMRMRRLEAQVQELSSELQRLREALAHHAATSSREIEAAAEQARQATHAAQQTAAALERAAAAKASQPAAGSATPVADSATMPAPPATESGKMKAVPPVRAEASDSAKMYAVLGAQRVPLSPQDRASAEQPSAYASIDATIASVTQELSQSSPGTKRRTSASIRLPGTVLLLSEAEINAFLDPTSDEEGVLRRSVAARIMVVDAVERAKRGHINGGVEHAVEAAQAELKRVETAIAAHQQSRQLEAAGALSAAHRQLSVVLQHALKRR